MKIRINVDCTPEEARRFFGLPDVSGINETITANVQQRIEQTIQDMDADTLLKTWLPGGAESWQQMQEAVWKHLASAMSGQSKPGGTGEDKE
jgi:Tfp pilus assembly PilM family ATPase